MHGIADARVAASGMRAHVTAEAAAGCDALLICVPTPLGAHKEPDLSAVRDTLAALAPHLRAGQAVAPESTTYPGTTAKRIRLPVRPFAARSGR